MRNFVENLLFISNELRYFVQNWFRIDTKMMRNFVHKKSFRARLVGSCLCTETNSHHTIQILKYFIYMHYIWHATHIT